MNVIRAPGDLSNVQASLDFYLKVTSIEGIRSIEELRKKLFAQFKQEEKERNRVFVQQMLEEEEKSSQSQQQDKDADFESIKSEASIVKNEGKDVTSTPNSNGKKTNFSSSTNAFLQMVNKQTRKNAVYKKHGVYIDEEEVLNNQEDKSSSSTKDFAYVSSGIFIDDSVEDIQIENSNNNSEVQPSYVPHGVYIDVPEENEISSECEKNSDEVVSHGIYIDLEEKEVDTQNEKSSEDDEKVHSSNEEKIYLPHGVYIDEVEETKQQEENESISYVTNGVFIDDEENTSSSNNSSSENLEVIEGNLKDYFEDPEDIQSYSKDSEEDDDEISEDYFEDSEELDALSKDLQSCFEDPENPEECFEESDATERVIAEEENDLSEDDLFSGLGEKTEEKSVVNNSSASSEDKIVYFNQSDVGRQQEKTIQVPNDLREFLRLYPSSTIDFVRQYYSQKDIDKQLKLGRVYKRKGKLFI